MPRQNVGFLDVLKRPNYRKPNKFDINRPQNDAFFSNFSNSTLQVIDCSGFIMFNSEMRCICLNLWCNKITHSNRILLKLDRVLHSLKKLYQQNSTYIYIWTRNILTPSTLTVGKSCFQPLTNQKIVSRSQQYHRAPQPLLARYFRPSSFKKGNPRDDIIGG